MTQSAQSVETRVMPHLKEAGEASLGIKYPTFIVFAIVLMMVALIYVGSHIRMTELEYNIAAANAGRTKKIKAGIRDAEIAAED